MSNLHLISTHMDKHGFSAGCIDSVAEFVRSNQISNNLNQIGEYLQLTIPLRVGFLYAPDKTGRVNIFLPTIKVYADVDGHISTRAIVIKKNSKTSHLNLQKKYDEKISTLKCKTNGRILENNRQIINGVMSVMTYGTPHDYIALSYKIDELITLIGGIPKVNTFDAPSYP